MATKLKASPVGHLAANYVKVADNRWKVEPLNKNTFIYMLNSRGWPTFAVSAKVGTYAARIAILILPLSD